MDTSHDASAPQPSLPRRGLLGIFGASLALGALAGTATAAERAEPKPTEPAGESLRIVKAFCASWSSLDPAKVMVFFADDAVYRVTETTPPTVGQAAIGKLVERFLQRAKKVNFEILRSYAVGPVVLTERHDHFDGPRGEQVFHVAGMFFVRDGKIAEWTDYLVRP